MAYGSSPVAMAVARVASRQHGIVDKHDLAGIGLPRSTAAGWVRAGRLHRLHPGVYSVVPPALLAIEGRWLAAVRACGPGAVLSHASAAQLLWLLDRKRDFGVHVSVPDRARRGPGGIVVHRPLDLPACDVIVRSRIPVTSHTRTAWDVSATLPSDLACRAFERADGDDRLDHARMQELLRGNPNHAGAGRLRDLAAARTLPLSEVRSWLEGLLLEVCSAQGLPIPAVNVPLLGYEADFLWARERFVVEADGGEHLRQAQRDSDNDRDITFGRGGLLVRRYTSKAMADEEAVAAEVTDILRERRR